MTESQYKEYVRIKEEIKPVKNMLFWCGNRYLNRVSPSRYLIRAIFRRPKLLFGRIGNGFMDSEEYELPRDLQDKLIAVMEDWLAEKEKQLEAI